MRLCYMLRYLSLSLSFTCVAGTACLLYDTPSHGLERVGVKAKKRELPPLILFFLHGSHF
jgi:hypothetical protein